MEYVFIIENKSLFLNSALSQISKAYGDRLFYLESVDDYFYYPIYLLAKSIEHRDYLEQLYNYINAYFRPNKKALVSDLKDLSIDKIYDYLTSMEFDFYPEDSNYKYSEYIDVRYFEHSYILSCDITVDIFPETGKFKRVTVEVLYESIP